MSKSEMEMNSRLFHIDNMGVVDPMNNPEFAAFREAYYDALLWITVVLRDPDEEPKPADEIFGFEDIESESLAQHDASLVEFFNEAYDTFLQTRMTFESMGHDHCLTRNGHGAGFWDRGYGDIGDKLSDISDSYGSVDLVEDDQGKLVIE